MKAGERIRIMGIKKKWGNGKKTLIRKKKRRLSSSFCYNLSIFFWCKYRLVYVHFFFCIRDGKKLIFSKRHTQWMGNLILIRSLVAINENNDRVLIILRIIIKGRSTCITLAVYNRLLYTKIENNYSNSSSSIIFQNGKLCRQRTLSLPLYTERLERN